MLFRSVSQSRYTQQELMYRMFGTSSAKANDMRAAGLNALLGDVSASGNVGSGAAATAAESAQMMPTDYSFIGDAATHGLAAYNTTRSVDASVSLQKSQENVNKSVEGVNIAKPIYNSSDSINPLKSLLYAAHHHYSLSSYLGLDFYECLKLRFDFVSWKDYQNLVQYFQNLENDKLFAYENYASMSPFTGDSIRELGAYKIRPSSGLVNTPTDEENQLSPDAATLTPTCTIFSINCFMIDIFILLFQQRQSGFFSFPFLRD